MKILVKTLKGSKIPIEADENSTVGAVKGIIVSLFDCGGCLEKKSLPGMVDSLKIYIFVWNILRCDGVI